MPDVAPDPYKYFRVEAQEILEQLGQGVLDLEKDGSGPELVSRMLRFAHTLKGAARVVKLPRVAEAAHALEDRFAAVRDAAGPMAASQASSILELLDGIQRDVDALSAPSTPAPASTPAPTPASVPASAPTATSTSAPAPGPHREPEMRVPAFRPGAEDMDALLDAVGDAQDRLTLVRPLVAQAERARHLVDLLSQQLSRTAAGDRARPHERFRPESATPSLVADVRRAVASIEGGCASAIDQLQRELTEVRLAAERLRLVPARAMFTFLERAVRDVAATTGKACVFEGHGGDVRLDASVLGALQAALLHGVRNAVVHGIESSPSERQTRGKPAEGRVRVEISRRGDMLSVVCADDGMGVDLDAVRTSLRRRGRPAAEVAALDTDALVDVLLRGGISTSASVDDISGRGVGLDVIRESASRIGARLSLRTTPGQGTSISLEFPFSLLAFPALLVSTDGTGAAIALEAVRHTLRVTPDDLTAGTADGSVVYDGRTIPYVSLARLTRSAAAPVTRDTATAAFVVDTADGTAAFGVDRILGTQSVMARALPELAPARAFVSGTSVDGSGRPLLVLDAVALVAEASRTERLEQARPSAPLPILVIDDSLTTRMLEQSILESAGYQVEVATSAEEGLVKARQQPHALFLVDVEMPGMDGFAFIEQVRADAVLTATPAILVTSRSAPEDLERGRAVGAQGYIVKGEFDQRALLDRIRTLVG